MLETMYITNNPSVAKIAQANGIDLIFLDLEVRGKLDRQCGRDTVQSKHSFGDVSAVREVLTRARLLVRVNSLWDCSRCEIDEAIKRGADIIMMPMFRTLDDAKAFVEMVGGRGEALLLAETIEAQENIAQIAAESGADSIHIGLNDLHIARGMNFMFELLADGTVEDMCKKIAGAGVKYGFGGIARLNDGDLPARNILAEHYRLGSSRVIIARSFCDTSKITDLEEIEGLFYTGMKEIRDFERELPSMSDEFFEKNRREVIEKTAAIVKRIREK